MKFLGYRPTVAEARYWQRVLCSIDRCSGDNRYRLPTDEFQAYSADVSELFDLYMVGVDAMLARWRALASKLDGGESNA